MRVLLVINARLAGYTSSADSPRKDYFALQRALAADVVDLDAVEQHRWTRMVSRLAGAAAAQAFLAWRLSPSYDSVFFDRESAGFAYAVLPRIRRRQPRLVMIAHLLSTGRKKRLVRALRLDRRIDSMIVHSSLQQQFAHEQLRMAEHRISLIPYQTDEEFWAPRPAIARNQICSAGMEYRDYGTLVEAAKGIDVDVVIAAASHWSKHRGLDHERSLPPNVRVTTLEYSRLRDLYAESRFVVVPLHDVSNQAGITAILEAMAMGKAVIVSHARGQTDVVRDRRRHSRSMPSRPTQPSWAERLGATREAAHGQTGIYVRPGDAAELRAAIVYLLSNPSVAAQMGANGRRLVEESMSLDHFTARVAAVIRGGISTIEPVPASTLAAARAADH